MVNNRAGQDVKEIGKHSNTGQEVGLGPVGLTPRKKDAEDQGWAVSSKTKTVSSSLPDPR